MKKKITIIHKVEMKRKERKSSGIIIDDVNDMSNKLNLKKGMVVTLKKLDDDMKKFEVIE